MGDVKVTVEQKDIMLNFMEEHPDFAKSKLLGPDGKKLRAALWEVLTTELNSVGGPKKSSAKWQRVWIDLKNKVKSKASAIRRSQQSTGGGPQCVQKLSAFEERMLAFLTEEAVHGIETQGTGGIVLDSEEVLPITPLVDETTIGLLPVVMDEPKAGPSTEGLISNVEKDITASEEAPLFSDSLRTQTPYSFSDDTSNEGQASPTFKKGKKKATSQQAFQTFAGLSERINNNIEGLIERIDTQNEIHRETNNLLRELIEVFKNK